MDERRYESKRRRKETRESEGEDAILLWNEDLEATAVEHIVHYRRDPVLSLQ